ncbi:MAG: hypothetical protein AABZ47_12465 [Planctomycetota bacterium]
MHRILSHPPAHRTMENQLPNALQALRNAANQLPMEHPKPKTRAPRHSYLAAIGGGIAVAAVVYLVFPQIYDCSASLRLVGNTNPTWLDTIHQRYLQSCSSSFSTSSTSPTSLVGWRTTVDPPDQLRLVVSSKDKIAGTELVQRISESFIADQEAWRLQTLSTPTETEQVLSSLASTIRLRIEADHGQVKDAIARLPTVDPREHWSTLENQWREKLAEFESHRADLVGRVKTLQRLRDQPDPSHAVVDPIVRQEALQADAALQQDFQELSVRLLETKQHLLSVWQKSAEPLESLIRASGDLTSTTKDSANPNAAKDEQAILQALRDSVGQHAEKLSAFEETWNREFQVLRQTEVQPQSDDILGTYSRLRNLLADFVFQGGELASHMRDRINELASASGDPARAAVLQSRLARSFQALQSAHHRFEFTVGILDSRANFKLDAALRASKALWKRSHQHAQEIETRLQLEATKTAKTDRQNDIASGIIAVEQSRAMVDETVSHLVSLQTELNQNTGNLENFLRDALRAEVTATQINTASKDLNHAEKQLRGFETSREAESRQPSLQLVGCDAKISTPRLLERLRIAGFAGFAASVVLFVGFRRIHRPT